MRIQLVLLACILLAIKPIIAQNNFPDDFCLSKEEKQLYDAVNKLRTAYEQPSLQHSASLTFVARLHIGDLQAHHPDTSVCNLSSWSDKGAWTACCYNRYIPDPECMWAKPKELTPYAYRGYEMVVYFEDQLSVDSIIKLWADSKEMLDILLTRGNYEKKKWECMGLSSNDHYLSVWFGQRKDQLRTPKTCVLSDSMPNAHISGASGVAPGKAIYYLIFGSFSNIKDAKEALKRYRKSGFEEAGILNKNSHIRIYLMQFESLKEAMYAKQNLPYTYNETWILKD